MTHDGALSRLGPRAPACETASTQGRWPVVRRVTSPLYADEGSVTPQLSGERPTRRAVHGVAAKATDVVRHARRANAGANATSLRAAVLAQPVIERALAAGVASRVADIVSTEDERARSLVQYGATTRGQSWA